MPCLRCKEKLPLSAKPCPNCGTGVTPDIENQVKQDIAKVKGEVIRTVITQEAAQTGVKNSTTQNTDSPVKTFSKSAVTGQSAVLQKIAERVRQGKEK